MTARDRSRSPHALDNTEEIVRLVATREQARLQKDWALADTLRTHISSMGVTIFDKERSWRSADGKSGRIPTFNELDGGNLESVIAQQALEIQSQQIQSQQISFQQTSSPLSGSMGALSTDAESQIKALVQQREQARANKDYTRSDEIREELKTMGVEVFDKEKMWRSTSGASGVILGYHARGGPTDLEITTLVVQREKVRQSGDFGTSDMIRNELRAVGVEVYDKEKVWKANDGRQGPVPTWQQVQAVCNTGGAIAAAAQPAMMGAMGGMPAMQTMAMMPGVAGGTTLMQQQVIQAALAAAQTPESAAQTLQLLQGGRGGGAAPQRGGLTRSAPDAAAVSLAHQQAMQIMSECASSGRKPEDAEILFLISIREKLRYKKDFQAADDLRNAMRNSINLELYEKEKRWATTDGRQGAIPMFNDLAQL